MVKHPDLAKSEDWLSTADVMRELGIEEDEVQGLVDAGLLTPHAWPGTERQAFDALEVDVRRGLKRTTR